MSNHGLTRTAEKEAVCLCGYRPEVLDENRPWTERQLKAKTAVLDHAQALNKYEAAVEALAQPATKTVPLRSPNDPFVVMDARYPRAGVRQTDDGRWLLSCWDGEQIWLK